MELLIAGASGFIGRQLVNALQAEHGITVVGRDESRLKKLFNDPVQTCSWNNLPSLSAHDFDAVINLSGYNISASRWNETVKQEIIKSRVDTTSLLINWIIDQQARPHIYCANAVGIYGLQENSDPHAFDEDSPLDMEHPKDFLNEIGIKWQKALDPAINADIPVTITRFGVVLKRREGILEKMSLVFKMGMGSVIGDGQQMLSWVHYEDLVGAYQFLLANPKLTGPFNLTSPCPVSQSEFARSLAHAVKRPLWLKTPAFVIRLLFGEMGETLILKGQRVYPKRLIEAGYQFKYPDINKALAKEFS